MTSPFQYRVLLSFLGVGKRSETTSSSSVRGSYQRVVYNKEKLKFETSLISVALNHFAITEKRPYQKIIVVGTAKSSWDALAEEVLTSDGNINLLEQLVSLEKLILESHHGSNILKLQNVLNDLFEESVYEPVVIPYGLNDNELKEIISLISRSLKAIQVNFEFDLDMTHSFRHIPMFLTGFLSFYEEASKSFQSGVMVNGALYYGIFEMRSESENEVPILNLKLYHRFTKWNQAAHNFLQLGNGYLLSHLWQEDANMEKKPQELKLVDNFKQLVLSVLGNLDQAIFRITGPLRGAQYRKDIYSFPGNVFLPETFQAFFNQIGGEAIRNSERELNLAEYYYKKQMYAQCYLTLSECLVTRACEMVGYLNIYSRENRESFKSPTHKETGLSNDLYWANHEALFPLYALNEEIRSLRNFIAHVTGAEVDQYSLVTKLEKENQKIPDLIIKIRKTFHT